MALVGLVVLAFGVAEGKIIWYSFAMRHLDTTAQGLLLEERHRLVGRRVFRDRWPRAGQFVLEHIVGAEARVAVDDADFLRQARRGDYLIRTPDTHPHPVLLSVRRTRRHLLCERRE